MALEINIGLWLVAFLPIIVLLILMVKFQWGASKAAPVGLLISLIIALVFFDADFELIAIESAKGLWNAFTILLIIWPAILIYEVTNEAQAFDAFRKGIQEFTKNELLQILAIGWVFVSFLQGITGFGVPIAVGAPLLVGIGVLPIWAVVIPLLAHSWAGTFGTLAVAWEALLFQTGYQDANSIAIWAGIFLWIINFIVGLSICWFYGNKVALKKGFPAVIIISTIHGGGQLLLSQFNYSLSAFMMTCIALGVVIILGKSRFYNEKWSFDKSPMMNREYKDAFMGERVDMGIVEAFLPYIVLTVLTILALLPPTVNGFLSSWKVGFYFKDTEIYSPISPLTHAGTFLFIAGLVGYFFYKWRGRIESGGGKRIFIKILKKTAPSSVALIGLIIMSKIMSGTGQTIVLATGVAKALDKAYVLLAPSIGLLGSFMTSSNMSSNILFGGFQKATSNILDLNEAAILGAQTAGGAIGNSIAPGSIILGTTTAGILGQEGNVLRKTLPIALTVAGICGLILYITLIVF